MRLPSLEYTSAALIFDLLGLRLRIDLLSLLNSYKLSADDDFVVPGTICGIVASSNSSDTVWFIRIKKSCIAERSWEDDYGYAIVAGQSYIIGDFLKKSSSNSKGHYFKVDNKTSYFYHENIVYPFAQFTEKKNEFFIENSEYFEIIKLLSIREWYPCLLLDFIYTTLHFTGFDNI